MNNKLFLLFIFLIASITFVIFSVSRPKTVPTITTFLESVESQDTQKNAANNELILSLRDPRKLVFVKSVATLTTSITDKVCINPHKQNVSLGIFSSVEKALAQGEIIEHICYGLKSNIGYLISSKIIGTNTKGSTADVNLYKFDTKTGLTEKMAQVAAGDYLGGCGEIKDFTNDGLVSFRCGWGEGQWSKSALYQYNVMAKTVKGLNYCTYQADKSYCSNYCTKTGDCLRGSTCSLETNSCFKQCKVDTDCLAQSCKPLGNAFACQ